MTTGGSLVLTLGLALALASPTRRAEAQSHAQAQARPQAQAQSQPMNDLRAERTMGRPDAPVTMYIMSDFECPYCGDFARRTMPIIEREYVATGKIKVVFVNMPLAFHRNAEPAAELAMCAARQHKFWPMHNLLFKYQDKWVNLENPAPFFLALGDSIGADQQELTTCLQTRATRALVKADYEGAMRSGAHATPSFYIEGGLLTGDQPINAMRPILDSIYRAKTEERH